MEKDKLITDRTATVEGQIPIASQPLVRGLLGRYPPRITSQVGQLLGQWQDLYSRSDSHLEEGINLTQPDKLD